MVHRQIVTFSFPSSLILELLYLKIDDKWIINRLYTRLKDLTPHCYLISDVIISNNLWGIPWKFSVSMQDIARAAYPSGQAPYNWNLAWIAAEFASWIFWRQQCIIAVIKFQSLIRGVISIRNIRFWMALSSWLVKKLSGNSRKIGVLQCIMYILTSVFFFIRLLLRIRCGVPQTRC